MMTASVAAVALAAAAAADLTFGSSGFQDEADDFCLN
jgi:hypothetical protein